jgi:RHS repeat-associated protein
LYFYYHPDHLGSLRLVSNPNQTFNYSMSVAPYGEMFAQSNVNGAGSFTGQLDFYNFDQYSFPMREYSDQGRWASPDPAGLAVVDQTTPQSWNRYAYVVNDPLALVDPLGTSYWFAGCLWETGVVGVSVGGTSAGTGTTDYLIGCLSSAPAPNKNGGGGGGGGGGLKAKVNICTSRYGIITRIFVPSSPGSNGNFLGQTSKGSRIYVENDVGAYTITTLNLAENKWGYLLNGKPIWGFTPGREPYLNYTASNLTPAQILQTQLHELGHSLDIITSGDPFRTSEDSANSFMYCVLE